MTQYEDNTPAEVWELAKVVADHLWVSDYVPGIGDKGDYVIDPRNLAIIILNAGYVKASE